MFYLKKCRVQKTPRKFKRNARLSTGAHGFGLGICVAMDLAYSELGTRPPAALQQETGVSSPFVRVLGGRCAPRTEGTEDKEAMAINECTYTHVY